MACNFRTEIEFRLPIKIKDLLLENGFSIENICENILQLEVNANKVSETDKYSPIVGYDLTGDDNIMYTINLEDNAFASFIKTEIDDEGYYLKETGFDDELNVLYVNDD